MRKVLASILIVGITLSGLTFAPKTAEAATTSIRQEVNITDAYMYAASGSYATSSETVAITDANYSNPSYFFEAIASSTSGTTGTAKLVNATTGATVATITMSSGNAYTRYRSTQFLPSASTTVEYKVLLGNEALGKGVIASRIVVLQTSNPLSATETQIEIGANETYTSNATSTFAAPKYWKYDSTKWSPTPTFYAEVTYARTVGVIAATTTNSFTTAGYSTVTASSTLIDIAAWGGGGAGKTGSASGGGDGGGGGSFASSSSQVFAIGDTIRLFIGAGGALTTADGATSSASTTAPTAIVIADGGKGGKADASVACGVATGNGGKGGLTAISTGTTKNAGGNGGAGCDAAGNNDQGGGGGGAGGPHGAGGAGSNGSATTGGGGGGGDGGGAGGQPTGGTSTNGGAGGAGGNAGNGAPGTASTNGAGGGGGGDNGTNGGAGTTYGAGGGGGEGAFAAGGNGAVTLTFKPVISATTTITLQEADGTGDGFTGWTDKVQIVKATDFMVSTSTRVRSAAFVPTSGRNYRIVFSNGYNGATFAIYNAKIIADQFAGSVVVEGWGAGGGGSAGSNDNKGGTGGGGGAYSKVASYGVLNSVPYTVTVGLGGDGGVVSTSNAVSGGDTSFNSTTMVAKGGQGIGNGADAAPAVGGLASAGTGDTKFSGGSGQQVITAGFAGGGGGGSAGDTSNGGDGAVGTGASSPGAGGSAGTTNGAVGGAGGLGNGNPGNAPGSGGGGGGQNVRSDGGLGANGKVVITAVIGVISSATGGTYTTSGGNDIWTFTSSGTWTPTLGASGTISKLEPQYMLAPFQLFSGTAAQNFLSLWDSSEWNTSNVYIHDVDAANNSTSVITLIDSGGSLVTNSTVTSPDNRGVSSSICTLSTGNLDVKATTNNSDIYASRILVQVGDTTSCVPPTIPPAKLRILKGLLLINGKLIIN